jgi:transcriptional regulator with XRE-family HTH domain
LHFWQELRKTHKAMGKLTHFAREFRAIRDRRPELSQLAMSQISGVSQGQISRYMNDEETPGIDNLERLCSALPKEDRIELVLAHLRDETPDNVKGSIRLEKVSSSDSSKARSIFDIELRTELRDAIYFLAREARTNPDVAEAIMSSCRILGFTGKTKVLQSRRLKDVSAAGARNPRKAARKDG